MKKWCLGVVFCLIGLSWTSADAMESFAKLFKSCCCCGGTAAVAPEPQFVDTRERCWRQPCQRIYTEAGVTFLSCGHSMCSVCARKDWRVGTAAKECPMAFCKQRAAVIFRLSPDQLQANRRMTVADHAELIAVVVAQGHAEALTRIDKFASVAMNRGTLNLSDLRPKLNDASFDTLLQFLVAIGVARTVTALALTGNQLREVPVRLTPENFPMLINVHAENDAYVQAIAARFPTLRARSIDLSRVAGRSLAVSPRAPGSTTPGSLSSSRRYLVPPPSVRSDGPRS